MPNGDNSMAQAVYLAQLSAAKGDCDCQACQLLRKASEGMTQEILGQMSGLVETRGPGKSRTRGSKTG